MEFIGINSIKIDGNQNFVIQYANGSSLTMALDALKNSIPRRRINRLRKRSNGFRI